MFMDPPPSAETVAALYRDAYQGATGGYFGKVDKKMRRSRGRARTLRRLLRDRPAPTLIDIGANGGFMVEAARQLGFRAVGVEIDPVSVAYARQHYPDNRFCEGSIESFAAQSDERFDAAYCSEVIEHVVDANSFVAAIAALLRPGGILYLTTPDIGHWRRPRDVTTWDAFAPPSHCLYFTRRALTGLLANHGLAIIRRRFNWKPGHKVLARKGDSPLR